MQARKTRQLLLLVQASQPPGQLASTGLDGGEVARPNSPVSDPLALRSHDARITAFSGMATMMTAAITGTIAPTGAKDTTGGQPAGYQSSRRPGQPPASWISGVVGTWNKWWGRVQGLAG